MTIVAGFMGAQGSGKDTAAKALIALGWVPLAFATRIYEEVSTAFGVSPELLGVRETKNTPLEVLALAHCQDSEFIRVALARHDDTVPAGSDPMTAPRSPRFILQTWGTEYRRRLFGERYWINHLAAEINRAPERKYALTDVRDPLEIEFTRALGGPLILVYDPQAPAPEPDRAIAQHATELIALTARKEADFALENPRGLEHIPALHANVLRSIRSWFPEPVAA